MVYSHIKHFYKTDLLKYNKKKSKLREYCFAHILKRVNAYTRGTTMISCAVKKMAQKETEKLRYT